MSPVILPLLRIPPTMPHSLPQPALLSRLIRRFLLVPLGFLRVLYKVLGGINRFCELHVRAGLKPFLEIPQPTEKDRADGGAGIGGTDGVVLESERHVDCVGGGEERERRCGSGTNVKGVFIVEDRTRGEVQAVVNIQDRQELEGLTSLGLKFVCLLFSKYKSRIKTIRELITTRESLLQAELAKLTAFLALS